MRARAQPAPPRIGWISPYAAFRASSLSAAIPWLRILNGAQAGRLPIELPG
jgi:hypothetical protein